MITHRIECVLTYDRGDAELNLIETAFMTEARIGVAEKDGAIATSGAQGWEGDYLGETFDLQGGDNDAVQKVSVTFVPDAERATASVKPSYATTA